MGRTEEARTTLPPTPSSARAARTFVRDTLRGWGLQGVGDVSALLVSELATNAIVHARTEIVLRVARLSSGVRVAVADASPLAPVLRPFEHSTMGGRGLALVESFATRWGIEVAPDSGGKTVWFEVAP